VGERVRPKFKPLAKFFIRFLANGSAASEKPSPRNGAHVRIALQFECVRQDNRLTTLPMSALSEKLPVDEESMKADRPQTPFLSLRCLIKRLFDRDEESSVSSSPH
jgi:hypothetical protein